MFPGVTLFIEAGHNGAVGATVGHIYCFPASLVVALILGVCTWIGWGLYQYARIQQSVVEEEQWVSL